MKMGNVERLTFLTDIVGEQQMTQPQAGPTGSGINLLRVLFEGPRGDMHTHDLPDGEFSTQNAALQFLAAIHKKPSDFDGMRLECSTQIPVVRNGRDSYALDNQIIETGAERIQEVVWCPMIDYDAEDKDESGTATDGDDDDTDADPIRATLDDSSRGLTFHVPN